MTGTELLVAALRVAIGALVTFIVVYQLLKLLNEQFMPGSDAQYFITGTIAFLGPLLATAVGSWQARSAGITRPLAGVAPAAAIGLAAGMYRFGNNETLREGFNTLQPILVILGAAIGAALSAFIWISRTEAR